MKRGKRGGGLPGVVKQVERGQVFEAPEAVMQQKVSVLEVEEEALESRKEPTCWSQPPPLVAAAELDARL